MQKLHLESAETELLRAIGACAKTLGSPAYAIGGFVRDRLLWMLEGKAYEMPAAPDIDIVCIGSGIALAEEIKRQIPKASSPKIYSRFGTAMLRIGDLELELVGARKESYTPESRKPSVEEGSLEDDQRRRDFSINALAISLQEEDFASILDPFNGVEDLQNGIIRTPLEPGQTFSDDPLRMLRAVRFASQLDFEIEESTKAGIAGFAERLSIISAERIHTELNKILLSRRPSKGLALLSELKLLPLILPELEAMKGVERLAGVGHKDNFWHTLTVVDNLAERSNDLWLTWAALLHDIGKPKTKRFENGQWTFHGHEVLGSKMVPVIFKRLRLPLDDQMRFVQKMVRYHQQPIALTEEEVTDSAIRRLLFEVGEDIDELLTLCEADITSRDDRKVQRYLRNYAVLRKRFKEVEERDHLRNWQPPISGEDIMAAFNLKPSKQVGIIKTAIREAILDGAIPNEHEAAWQLMLEEAAKLGIRPVRKV